MQRKLLFPPQHKAAGESRLRHKGRQTLCHDTVNGTLRIERIRWWSRQGGCDETIDQVLGIVAASVSVGVRQMCSRVGITPMGFRRASGHLEHLAQIRISPERLRQLAEQEGQRVMTAQAQGQIAVSLTPERAKVSPDGPTRIYVGADGVKVPMVTAAEKAQRRARRGPKRSGSRRRRMHRGADNTYKEFKIATFYEQSNEYRQVLATAGDHTVLGRLIRRAAQRLGFNRFDQKLGLGDGADWILRQLAIRLPSLDQFMLDFYHFSEHVWSASNGCWGLASQEAHTLAEDLLHRARHEGPAAVLLALEAERRRHPTGRQRQALQELIGYLTKRAPYCEYPRYRSEGWQIGSGPTEAMCKVLTYRLKGAGMRWDREGAEPIMALLALEQSNAWESYWTTQVKVA
jgi:hypothetical protein